MRNPLDFTGKVALVTGAASGMGLAAAQAFAEAGAAVVMADFREDMVRSEAQTLINASHKAIAVRCDVSDDRQVEEMVKRAVAEFGRLDAAFNNAGTWPVSFQLQRALATSGIASSASTSAVYGAR